MHDGMSLEAMGIPTAVIITTEFVREAEVQRAALGMNALEPVVIQHPLSTLSEEEIRARASGALVRVSATTISFSVPVAESPMPKAATQPLRTPGTLPTSSSTSCG